MLTAMTCLCCLLSVPGAFWAGQKSGARAVFDEIGGFWSLEGSHAGVPLYEGGEPAAVLWIQRNVEPGEDRHMAVRKPSTGCNWELESRQISEGFEARGLSGSSDADYIHGLLVYWNQRRWWGRPLAVWLLKGN